MTYAVCQYAEKAVFLAAMARSVLVAVAERVLLIAGVAVAAW